MGIGIGIRGRTQFPPLNSRLRGEMRDVDADADSDSDIFGADTPRIYAFGAYGGRRGRVMQQISHAPLNKYMQGAALPVLGCDFEDALAWRGHEFDQLAGYGLDGALGFVEGS